MRRLLLWVWVFGSLAAAAPVAASTARILKVLPQFLDLKGRNSLSPSLYERDAYQVVLREHPDQRSGVRFAVHWKTKDPPWGPLKLRLELRGSAEGTLPRQLVLEQALLKPAGGWFGRWTNLTVDGEEYQKLGAVTAWRVTLWEGETLLAKQESFLW
jgi:hypothetical protein